jgi:hypothetical protein
MMFPWLAGAVASGGVVGPILLVIGLARTDATTASLPLTLEGAATALMANAFGPTLTSKKHLKFMLRRGRHRHDPMALPTKALMS